MNKQERIWRKGFKSGICVGILCAVVGMWIATPAHAAEPEDIQIIKSSTKDIGYIVHNRQIRSIQYRVQFLGYYVECVSVVSTTRDGTRMSTLYNKCASHMDDTPASNR